MKLVDKIELQRVESPSVLFGFDLGSKAAELDLAREAVSGA